MDCCKELLAEVSKRFRKYPPHQPLSGCNVFQILGIGWDEVKMCRFLANLLDPEGNHGGGILFLKSFFRAVLPECPISDTLLAHTCVATEFLLENGRRIDIVIQNIQYFIPIEVKIDAPEQEGQCYDYCQYARNAPIIYLTRFGSAPSEYSLRQKDSPNMLPPDRVRCISWSRNISRWLSALLPQLDGPVKFLVEQYIDTIYHIANEWGSSLMEQSIQAVLASPEFFRAGLELERSMKTAKLTLMRRVFECFKEEMEPAALKYGLEPENDTHYYSYEMPNHEKFYDCYSTYPGLNYVVKRAKFKKSSLQLWFRVEVMDNLYAGFALFDTEGKPQDESSKGYQVDDITPALVKETAKYLDRDIITPSDWWLSWCYPNGSHRDDDYPDVPNFKTMNQCATDLVDPQKRREYVRKAVQVFGAKLLAYLL